MVVLLKKQHIYNLVMACCCLVGLLSVILTGIKLTKVQSTFSAFAHDREVTWIIDAGHGGEDGGAVAANGITESSLNLQIANSIHDVLRFSGEKTALTRSGEEDVHTEGDTIRARKASDIRNRVALVNGIPDAVLLSIHQNSLPSSPVTHGAQVFWNREEGSDSLAKVIQNSLNQAINHDNEKIPKRIPETIYLMKHVTVPSVLIECGFLSNVEETELLQAPSYQKKLAAAISAGCLQAIAGEEISE